MADEHLPIAIYYEHPDWFRPLFSELDRRGTPYVRLDAARQTYDPGALCSESCGLFFNRMSASAYLRGNGHAIFFTRDYLAHLERSDIRVINGAEAFSYEISKAKQLSLLRSLGIPFPRSRIINDPEAALSASEEIGFPLIIKPNIGGRGAGIIRLNSAMELYHAFTAETIDLGLDQTAIVQEFVPAHGGHIHRVETLAGKVLYAMEVFTTGESFNLCPAEICQIENAAAQGAMCLADGPAAGLKIELYQPPAEIITAVERIVAAAGIDVGGVEYIIDARDGRVLFYDINALSNFVADAPRILGFDPHARLVDYLERERDRT